ncbi:MAG: hypothetical protein HYV09_24485 [Deltaproteobacteria bacterium]|nr:hypothetical protein [Deltaproteobacteria bacterium]
MPALAVVAIGCASDKIRTRAANDFQCSFGQVKITDLDTGAYRATGCGQTADYFCNGKGCVKSDGAEAKETEAAAPKEPADPPDVKTIKKPPAKFKLHTSFQRDKEEEGEVYKDEKHFHAVRLNVGPHTGDADTWLDQNFLESKRWTESFGKIDLRFATKLTGGERISVSVVVRDGKAYELGCSSLDTSSPKTDEVCMKVLRTLRVDAAPPPPKPAAEPEE